MKTIKGFSLVEMIAVIAILAIMTSISSFFWYRYVANSNLRTTARILASDMNSVKLNAVSKVDKNYTIYFDKTANTYSIKVDGTTVQTKSLAPPEQAQGHTFIDSLPGGGDNYTLTFLARGIFSPSTGTITLKNNLNNNKHSEAKITFNMTGRIYVAFTMQ